jgi:hypothetical protein
MAVVGGAATLEPASFTPEPAASKRITTHAQGDAVVRMLSPAGTSRRYRCGINRDSGWAVLGEAGFEAVRQVTNGEDGSALRFRRVEFITSMTRTRSRRHLPGGPGENHRPVMIKAVSGHHARGN